MELVLEQPLQIQNVHLSQHLMLSTIVAYVILASTQSNQMSVKDVLQQLTGTDSNVIMMLPDIVLKDILSILCPELVKEMLLSVQPMST